MVTPKNLWYVTQQNGYPICPYTNFGNFIPQYNAFEKSLPWYNGFQTTNYVGEGDIFGDYTFAYAQFGNIIQGNLEKALSGTSTVKEALDASQAQASHRCPNHSTWLCRSRCNASVARLSKSGNKPAGVIPDSGWRAALTKVSRPSTQSRQRTYRFLSAGRNEVVKRDDRRDPGGRQTDRATSVFRRWETSRVSPGAPPEIPCSPMVCCCLFSSLRLCS